MELSDNLRRIIAEEFSFISKKIQEETDLSQKIYFFSGSFGMIQRIFNLEYDPELILIHSILRNAHAEINTRVVGIISGQEKVIKLPERLFSSLADAIKELGEAILNKKDCSEYLQKLAVMSYIASGNGYYLFEKGVLKI